jgi:hypothetical protein
MVRVLTMFGVESLREAVKTGNGCIAYTYKGDVNLILSIK